MTKQLCISKSLLTLLLIISICYPAGIFQSLSTGADPGHTAYSQTKTSLSPRVGKGYVYDLSRAFRETLSIRAFMEALSGNAFWRNAFAQSANWAYNTAVGEAWGLNTQDSRKTPLTAQDARMALEISLFQGLETAVRGVASLHTIAPGQVLSAIAEKTIDSLPPDAQATLASFVMSSYMADWYALKTSNPGLEIRKLTQHELISTQGKVFNALSDMAQVTLVRIGKKETIEGLNDLLTDKGFYEQLAEALPDEACQEFYGVEMSAVNSFFIKGRELELSNILGIVALSQGLEYFMKDPTTTPVQILNDIILQKGIFAENGKGWEFMCRCANTTWKTVQPWRVKQNGWFSRMQGAYMTGWDELDAEVKRLDYIQIQAAAKLLLAAACGLIEKDYRHADPEQMPLHYHGFSIQVHDETRIAALAEIIFGYAAATPRQGYHLRYFDGALITGLLSGDVVKKMNLLKGLIKVPEDQWMLDAPKMEKETAKNVLHLTETFQAYLKYRLFPILTQVYDRETALKILSHTKVICTNMRGNETYRHPSAFRVSVKFDSVDSIQSNTWATVHDKNSSLAAARLLAGVIVSEQRLDGRQIDSFEALNLELLAQNYRPEFVRSVLSWLTIDRRGSLAVISWDAYNRQHLMSSV